MYQFNYVNCYFLIFFLNVEVYCQRFLQGAYGPEQLNTICSSQIYCYGELLEDIQMARIYPDSKTFVDMKLLNNQPDIVKSYRDLKNRNNGRVPNQNELKQFIDANFAEDPLVEWLPTDFTDNPTVAENITDPYYRKWILDINNIWKSLARKIDEDARINPNRHSSIYLPNGFFIAGGRFRELYYWDTYWIIRGALTCDMKETVKGILENFIYLVQCLGYVPNGNRVYYLNRSQPPLLIQMVASYFKFTNDIEFLRKNIQYLEMEFNYWMKNRIVRVEKSGNIYLMAQYNTRTIGPRPESYYEDKTLAMNLPSEIDQNELYSRLKTAAESGWDFSSKHYNNFGENTGNLTFTDPQNFIQVELNAILQANADVLSDMFGLLGNTDKKLLYAEIGMRFQMGIDCLLWDEDEGMWFDYDLTTKLKRKYFYASNFAPLWSGSYNKNLKKMYGKRALDYLIKNNFLTVPNLMPKAICVPASDQVGTDQQWDYPNCWPPLQIIIIQGLYTSEYVPAQSAAFNLAKIWIRTNYIGYKLKQTMFEKYSALVMGSTGGGGEYVPQTGFGWTNGVIFELFWKWGSVLKYV